MKLARYAGKGRVEICDEPEPKLPKGGLLVQTQASGLCSGELMDWYMERKVPHVLGHEVSGRVVASEDTRFPVGSRVAPHHHAPCNACEHCGAGRFVHCLQWKRTRLDPGGMAEVFAVGAENLEDTHAIGDMRAVDAALIEPLGCVIKSLGHVGETRNVAVIGLGSMGLMHMAMLREHCPAGIELLAGRRKWAEELGFEVTGPDINRTFDAIVVCPGTQGALDLAFRLAAPQAKIVLFAPFPPDGDVRVPLDRLYFEEISLIPSYSCGPFETAQAIDALRQGLVRAEQIVSDFIGIDELPRAYEAMKRSEILKAMVMFE